MKTVKALLAISVLGVALSAHANPRPAGASNQVETTDYDDFNQAFKYGKVNAGLSELDQATGAKWSQLEDWQKKESWINEQVRLGVVGTIYESGMIGGTVSRNVVPDKDNGFLVVDKITVSAGPLLTIGNLAGNLFFQEVFPYVQAGVDFGRTYINVRSKPTYKDALLANPFTFKTIPASIQGFSRFEKGEIVSTVTYGGVFVRAGASIFDLMGMAVTWGAGIGPRAKIHVNKQFKMTFAKHNDNEVLVLVEDALETGLGLGITTGISIDDLIDAPVSIGINSQDGYSPIRVNYKIKNEKLRSIIYRIDIRSKQGAKAYEALMDRDFSLLDDFAELKTGKGVTRELIRDGVRDTSEFNAGLDLVFYRSGFRDIDVEANFRSTYANGKKFKYKELTAQKVNEISAYDGTWQSDEKYQALIPTSADDRTLNSFVIDSTFQYTSSDTTGEDLGEMLKELKRTVNQLPVSTRVHADKDYGQVSMWLTVRFPAKGVLKVINVNDRELWLALGVSSGLANPGEWTTQAGRQSWLNRADDGEAMTSAGHVRDFLRRLKAQKSMSERARMLIEYLKADNDSKLLHRTMIEIIGRDQLLIRGKIQGSNGPRGKLKPRTKDD